MNDLPWQLVLGIGVFLGYVAALCVREFRRGLRGPKKPPEA